MGKSGNEAMNWEEWGKQRWKVLGKFLFGLLGPFFLYGFVTSVSRGNQGGVVGPDTENSYNFQEYMEDLVCFFIHFCFDFLL